jgi:hypothetical protein
MKLLFFFLISTILIASCKNEPATELVDLNENIKKDSLVNLNDEKVFIKFNPDSISKVKINNVTIDYSYKINKNKIIIGNYETIDENLNPLDSEQDFGDRLFFLNENNEIIFKGKGMGDVFLYEPHFYRNNENNKIVIVCQLGYEYFFGGDVFLLENGVINHLGVIDIESTNMETKLIEILKIKEIGNKIIFTFNSDSLLLKPGSEDIVVKNNNIRYEYNQNSFQFFK